jgi:hypothetical protein
VTSVTYSEVIFRAYSYCAEAPAILAVACSPATIDIALVATDGCMQGQQGHKATHTLYSKQDFGSLFTCMYEK